LKKRVDELLVEQGYFTSRNRARDEILSGNVKINGATFTKPGKLVNEDVSISLEDKTYYVSRGAYKLLKALDEFEIKLSNKVCYDFGSSTGGFTQVMLERGATHVYAVDIGHGELKVEDPRITLMEGTNVRSLKREDFDRRCDFIACDLSFISLKLILPVLKEMIDLHGEAVCLIKPQFEVGLDKIKRGVVRSKELHLAVLEGIIDEAKKVGFKIGGLTFSPIRGGDGNIEFLIELNYNESKSFDLLNVVNSAWITLEGSKNVHYR